MNRMRGLSLVKRCQEHLVEVMRSLPECNPGGAGLRQRELAVAAGFEVTGDLRDVWFVSALLGRLETEGRIETIPASTKEAKRFRLRNHL